MTESSAGLLLHRHDETGIGRPVAVSAVAEVLRSQSNLDRPGVVATARLELVAETVADRDRAAPTPPVNVPDVSVRIAAIEDPFRMGNTEAQPARQREVLRAEQGWPSGVGGGWTDQTRE